MKSLNLNLPRAGHTSWNELPFNSRICN